LIEENSSQIKAHSEWQPINQIQNMIHKEFIEKNYPGLIEEAFRDKLAAFYESKSAETIDPEKMVLDEKDQLLLEQFKKLVYEKIRNRKTYRSYSRSGIYFVGYGEKSLYPSYWGVDAYGFLNGKFIYENDWRREVSSRDRSWYKTLAQDDSIEAFLIGVNETKRYEMMNLVKESIDNKFLKIIEKETDQKEKLTGIHQEIKETLTTINYFEDINDQGESLFLQSISVMGVMDMAEYAENLISLQSLKRKYDLDHRNNSTVGGPTDLAIITKFEGFKWLKFKGLNPTINHK